MSLSADIHGNTVDAAGQRPVIIEGTKVVFLQAGAFDPCEGNFFEDFCCGGSGLAGFESPSFDLVDQSVRFIRILHDHGTFHAAISFIELAVDVDRFHKSQIEEGVTTVAATFGAFDAIFSLFGYFIESLVYFSDKSFVF